VVDPLTMSANESFTEVEVVATAMFFKAADLPLEIGQGIARV